MAGEDDATASAAGSGTDAAFLGNGTYARFIATFDWSRTPVGAIAGWPPELRTVVGLALRTSYPTAVWWGPDYCCLPNKAYLSLMSEQGCAPGVSFDDAWGETELRGQFDAVVAAAHGRLFQDARIDMVRAGRLTETYWSYSIGPVTAIDGRVLGLFHSGREVTGRVLAARRDALLVGLDDALAATDTVDALIDAAVLLIGRVLDVKRVGLAEIDRSTNVLHIRRCWQAAGVPDARGRYPIGSWGAITRELERGHTVVVDDYTTDPRTADPETQARYRAIDLAAGIVVPIIERGAYVGGVFVQQNTPRAWSAHDVALATAATQRLWQAITRVRADRSLRESEQRHRLIFEQAEDIMFTTGLDGRIASCNPASARALGYPTDALVGRSIADFMAPGEFERTRPRLRHKLQPGETTRYEVEVIGDADRRMRWEVNSSLAQDSDGRTTGLYAVARDVTERRAFEERQALLIHELNHRVKNTLSLVQALAHQSFRAGEDPQSAQREFVGRLGTLAAAHDLLTREQWEGVTLGDLVATASATLAKGRISADGPAATVTPKAAVAVAMALHELGTNAIKYGALSNEAGHVDVRWRVDGERLRLDWRERDGPSVAAPTRRGFGVRMIERALASDLDARVHVEFAAAGVSCAIDAPRKGNMI